MIYMKMNEKANEEEMSEREEIKLICLGCQTFNKVMTAGLSEVPVCDKCGVPLLTGRVGELTTASFTEIIENTDLPVVVNFWTSWCGHCRNFESVFAGAAGELKLQALLFKVETEEEPELVRQFAMMTTPTQVVFRGGKEVARQTGVLQLPLLMEWLKPHLS